MLNIANKFVCSVLILVAVMPVALSQTRAARMANSARRMADAMVLAGLSVSPDQIELLSGISSTRESARVRVVSVTDTTAGTVKVKLRCQDNQECLPFYVLVHGLDGTHVSSVGVGAVPVNTAKLLQNVVRSGDHATLILETPDSRISLPVICLQSGALGQRIRVASPDRRQFFDAEVVATGMVKGSL